jgi:orotate phosphoribosyltransferase
LKIGRSIVPSSNGNDLQEEVLKLFDARRGHFRFESGYHGDLWLEIPPAYIHPYRLRRFAAELARLLAAHDVEAVCGPLVEGALLAQMVAEEIRAEFCFAEQFTRPETPSLFPLLYRVPKTLRGALRGKRTVVVDDVINAGSAVRGAIDDLEACGAHIVGIGALLTLGSPASAFAARKGLPLDALAHIPNNSLWEPSSCPLCASGTPMT